MGPPKRDFHPVDPLDFPCDPLDQPNENGPESPWPHALAAPPFREQILALRRKLRLTQREFAGYYGFPVATLRHWERGNREPTGTAYILLQLIRENPRLVLRAVQKARARDPRKVAPIKPHKSLRAPPGYGRYEHLRRRKR